MAKYHRGYIAFAPEHTPITPAPVSLPSISEQNQPKVQDHDSNEAYQAHLEQLQHLRAERLAREVEQAHLSELAWVRSGGVIRDYLGRKDLEKTERLKEEVRVLEEEARVRDVWKKYESQWKAISSMGEGKVDTIAWEDIPWPVNPFPPSSAELTSEAIAQFIFAPLTLRNAKGTKKDKIRQALLRWHPDKVAGVLSRVKETDEEAVRDGVNVVFMALKELQDQEKQHV